MEREKNGIFKRTLQKVMGNPYSKEPYNPIVEENLFLPSENPRSKRNARHIARVKESWERMNREMDELKQSTRGQEAKIIEIDPEFGDKLPPHP